METLEIRIKGEDFGNTMQLCVIDSGCGISPERLKELSKQPSGSALHQLSQSLNLAFNA